LYLIFLPLSIHRHNLHGWIDSETLKE